jgi:uncharacterized membrane protein
MAENGLNVAPWERWVSLAGGAALLASALRRPSPVAIALAAGGALLLERGLTGQCALYRALGFSSRDHDVPQRDAIETASDDSFPASDPPAWTPTSPGGAPRTAH